MGGKVAGDSGRSCRDRGRHCRPSIRGVSGVCPQRIVSVLRGGPQALPARTGARDIHADLHEGTVITRIHPWPVRCDASPVSPDPNLWRLIRGQQQHVTATGEGDDVID
jgi:hypothetical protein